MTKTMKNMTIPARRRSGFTLIEMLVVAALIAIFAGLAVFNIVEQLNREKEKAALSEARSIATAMSFAYDDLGFFPKLCFLRFGVDELLRLNQQTNLPNDSLDWFERGGPTMWDMVEKNWGEKYMAGSMPDKFVTMQMTFRSGGQLAANWPADPFNQPYMGYFLKVGQLPNSAPDSPRVIRWASDSLGDKANYFAGIVSYGRNKVPGYAWNDPRVTEAAALGRRLYDDVPAAGNRTFQTNLSMYTAEALDWFVNTTPAPVALNEPWTGEPPRMRQAGSDDKYFEF